MKDPIDFFDNGTWSVIESPFGEEADYRDMIAAAGFAEFERLGGEDHSGTALTIYIGKEPRDHWLCTLDTWTYGRSILVADFPSVITLINLLLPWITAANDKRKLELIEEGADLLYGYRRTAGPLADCIEEREQQRREDSRRAKAARDAEAAKAKAKQLANQP